MQTVLLGLIVGLIYFDLATDQNGVQDRNGVIFFVLINQSMLGVFGVINTFPLELPVFRREHSAGMYTPWAYYLSKTISEIPHQVFFPFVFCCICYPMVGLNPEPERFIMFCVLVILCANTAFALGYCLSTAAASVEVALAFGPVVILPFMLFAGFFLNVDSIPSCTQTGCPRRAPLPRRSVEC